MNLYDIDLTLFDAVYDGGAGSAGVELNTNTTGSAGLSPENKTFWDKALIVLAAPELIHDQFAQQRDIPAGSGKTIEFRQFDPLPEATTPLTEGVTPNGQELYVNSMTATVSQYGGYVTTSDVLDMTALDPIVNEATKLIARQAGETLDTVTRDVVNAGTNVIYAAGTGTAPTSRAALAYTSAHSNSNLTVADVKRAVRALKRQDAPTIAGDYVGIIHPDVAFDLMADPGWLDPKKYVDTDGIYSGEIGKLYGVRFIENTRAKVFRAPDLTETDGDDAGARTLTVASVSTKTVTIDEKLTTAQAAALAGRQVIIAGDVYTVASAAAGAAGSATVTVKETPGAGVADGAVIYPGEAGAAGADVYSTLITGADAYGTTKVTGGGLQHIVKPLGSGGSSDPLDQRATVGWKATKTAKILVEQYMVRVESTATP